MTTTTGRFDLTSWDEEVVDDNTEGAKLVRARNTKSFEGGITGTSAAELLQAIAGETGAYVAMERVTAAVDGRKGTFVLRHSALQTADGQGDMRVDVVPGSGTGELAGLTGTLTIALVDGEHTYTFDYTL